MSDEKKINPIVKLLLDLGPLVVFFIAYSKMKDQTFSYGGEDYNGFIVVTLLFVPLLALTTFILYRLTGKISVMQIMTLLIVVVFGGLTVWLNDERFFKMKPTLIYVLFAGILGFGLLRGKSYLMHVMDEAMPLQLEGWMILTKRLALFFAGLAVANEFVWRTMSTDTWVNFKVFGLTIAMFAFFMTQGKLMQKYAIEEKEES
ncbi:MAG TPA: intracellular septation protein A [Rhodobacteraceae bacterium]|jgi:intracellular septation protein|nr:intracellular septation protein A [Paracoccaceae bacterium]